MKLETIASPDSRSDCGRKLQKGFGWTLGAEGASVFVAGVAMFVLPSGHRQAEVARDLAREGDDELSVVEGDRGRGRGGDPGGGARGPPGSLRPGRGSTPGRGMDRGRDEGRGGGRPRPAASAA